MNAKPAAAPRKPFAARLVPHPILSVLVALVWIFAVNEISAGSVLMGAILGFVIPLATAAFWPDRPVIRNKRLAVEYMLIVFWDILVSGVQVARLVLFRQGDSLKSRWITVPLDVTSPEAIAVLSGTITMTPGTLTADVSADGRNLLVHCLETEDPDATVAEIKTRYERRLKEILP